MKLLLTGALSLALIAGVPNVYADDYVIDTDGAHAFVQFRVKHLGYSWLYGRFNEFSGEFSYDEKHPEKNAINVKVNVQSLDTNHGKRDVHIRSDDFLDAEKFPESTFSSTRYVPGKDGEAKLEGNLTLHGVTKPVVLMVKHIGGGKDPWGGYRQGFEASVTIQPADWGIPMAKKLGPASADVELILSVEGKKK